MKNKFTAVILSAAVAMSATTTLAACDKKSEAEKSNYTIVAQLSTDNILTASVACEYVNNNDVPLDELWFHLYPNAFRQGATVLPMAEGQLQTAYPNGRSYCELQISSVNVNGSVVETTLVGEDENVLSVELSDVLEPTEKTTVTIDYTLKLPNVIHRFGYNSKTVNLANFYPIACVYKDGAFASDPYYSTGDPFYSECADYDVTLSVPEKYEGAFTGVVKNEVSADGVTTYEIEARSVRDFAAVFGEFKKSSGVAGTTVVNYYYYDDSSPEVALNAAIDAVSTFNGLFGNYPYEEYSVVQTQILAAGMEYPCLSMVSDKYSGNSAVDVIVHETAHQWWYGVVGNDEVRNAWLDEAMAEYSTMLFYEQNTENYSQTFNAKRADALSAYVLYCETYKNNGLGDTSMTRAVNEYSDATEYAYMTYVKGSLMLDDVRNTIGSAAFMRGLKNYYTDMSYKLATPADLIGAMEKSSKRKLNALFDSWLDGNVKLFSNS